MEAARLWDVMVAESVAKLKAGGVTVRRGGQEGLLRCHQADPREVRREAHGADQAHRRHEIAPPFASEAGRRWRPVFWEAPSMDLKARYRQAMEALYLACIVDLRHRAGRHHADHPARRVHALRDEQPAVVARAGVGADDGDVLVPRRRRGLPRERAHRGGGARQGRRAGHAPPPPRRGGRVHDRDLPVHGRLRRDISARHCGTSRSPSSPGSRSGSPTCRSRSAASSRCSSSSSGSGSERRPRPRSCTATSRRRWSRPWTSSFCSARSPSSARSGCRSPTRSGLPRSSPRSGWTSRSRR